MDTSNRNAYLQRCSAAALFLMGLAAVLSLLYEAGLSSYHVGARARADGVLDGAPIQALVLGNSHGHCVKLQEMGLSGRNLSLGGQDMLETTYTARVLMDRARGLEHLFIPVSLFSFRYDNVAKSSKRAREDMSQRIDMYAAYPSLVPLRGDRNSYVKGMLHPLITADHWQRVLTGILGTHVPKPKAVKQTERQRAKRQRAKRQRAKRQRAKRQESGQGNTGQAARKHAANREARAKKRADKRDARLQRKGAHRCDSIRRAVRDTMKYDPDIGEQVYDALSTTIAHAQAKEVRLVLFTPPYHHYYTRCIPDSWKRQVSESMGRLVRKFDVEYQDLHADPEFVRRNGWFANSDHLNKKGERAFSRKLAALIAHATQPR